MSMQLKSVIKARLLSDITGTSPQISESVYTKYYPTVTVYRQLY